MFKTYLNYPFNNQETNQPIGILLINQGSPTKPSKRAVRKFIRQLLTERRLVEKHRLRWKFTLYVKLLFGYTKQITHAYQNIWQQDGSPSFTNSHLIAENLQHLLQQQLQYPIKVALGFRYGKPNIPQALTQLRSQHCHQIIMLPLIPQYASASSGCFFDAMTQHLQRWRCLPELRTVNSYANDPGYIHALVEQVNLWWHKNEKSAKTLFVFDSLSCHTTDNDHLNPYTTQCLLTSQLLAHKLNLNDNDWECVYINTWHKKIQTFPSLQQSLHSLALAGTKEIDIITPGMTTDCFANMALIAQNLQQEFIAKGGQRLAIIPSLNSNPSFIQALANICRKHMHGWNHDN